MKLDSSQTYLGSSPDEGGKNYTTSLLHQAVAHRKYDELGILLNYATSLINKAQSSVDGPEQTIMELAISLGDNKAC